LFPRLAFRGQLLVEYYVTDGELDDQVIKIYNNDGSTFSISEHKNGERISHGANIISQDTEDAILFGDELINK
jgi:hypothetical protein|tara:strand:+ start:120 stop:338 length:219 start_codon:yes stop_codon:yes gene_type:complete